MRKIFFTLLALTIGLFANAQKAGIKAGVTLPNQLIGSVSQKTIVGYQIGGMIALPIGPLEIEADLLLTSKGSRYEEKVLGKTFKLTNRLLYLDLPVKLNYMLDLKKTGIFIGAGPTFSYGLFGKIKSEIIADDSGVLIKTKDNWTSEKKVSWGDKEENDFKPLDMSVSIHAGVKLIDKIRIAVGYDIGFKNIAKDFEIMGFVIKSKETKNNVLSVSFAYIF